MTRRRGTGSATVASVIRGRRGESRAGLTLWPRRFHNLRATRQTELEERFPSHVVCAWVGNSERVAHKHYLQLTDDPFNKALQNALQHPSENQETGGNDLEPHNKKPPDFQRGFERLRL